MIDIDIVGQLVPNPLTMIVQLCSTFVLFLIARMFLWESVKKYLDARATKMQEDLTASEEAKKEALSDRQKALAQLQEASGKADDIVNAAVKQAKDEKTAILEQAGKEADALLKKAHEQIEAERIAMYGDVRNEMVEVAIAAAGKLIGAKNGEELDREAIDAFIKDAESYDE